MNLGEPLTWEAAITFILLLISQANERICKTFPSLNRIEGVSLLT